MTEDFWKGLLTARRELAGRVSPEGLAVSMPLMREGISPLKSFWYGQLSGLVEPIGGVLGAAFVHYCRPMLPYTMCARHLLPTAPEVLLRPR